MVPGYGIQGTPTILFLYWWCRDMVSKVIWQYCFCTDGAGIWYPRYTDNTVSILMVPGIWYPRYTDNSVSVRMVPGIWYPRYTDNTVSVLMVPGYGIQGTPTILFLYWWHRDMVSKVIWQYCFCTDGAGIWYPRYTDNTVSVLMVPGYGIQGTLTILFLYWWHRDMVSRVIWQYCFCTDGAGIWYPRYTDNTVSVLMVPGYGIQGTPTILFLYWWHRDMVSRVIWQFCTDGAGIWYPWYTDNTVSVLMVPGIWYPRYTDNSVSVWMVPGIWYPRYTDNTVPVLVVPGIWYPRYTDNTVSVLMVPGIWYPRYTNNTVSVVMVPGIWYPRYTNNTVSVVMVPGIWYPRYTDNSVSVLMVPGIWYPRYTDNSVSVLMVPGIWYPRYTDNTVPVLMVPGIWYPRYTDNTVPVLMVPGIWYPRYTDNTVPVLMVPGIWYYWYKYSTCIDMKLLRCMNIKLPQTQIMYASVDFLGLSLVKYYGWK